jgi:phosphatidyl-myo-inositol dimannoside synthase
VGLGQRIEGKVKVLALTPDFPPTRGGIQLLVDRVLRYAERLESRVVTLDSPGAGSFDVGQPFAVRRVPRIARARKASFALLNAVAVHDALKFRPQAVLSGHIVTGPAAWTIAKLVGAQAVQYLHADEVRAAPRMATFALRQAGAVVVVSRHTERLARAAGADAERIHRIPPGVDPVDDSGADKDGRPTLLTVARLEDEYKGHDVVLRALPLIAKEVPDVRWVVLGDGSLRPRLEGLAAKVGVKDHVRFLGDLADDERDRWYRRAHVFVMPSRLPQGGGGEGFGIVYLEAAAHGLPVVAGNVGGAQDAVIHGETGLLVEPTDARAVAEAATALFRDRELAARLGHNGAMRARQFEWPVIARRVEDLIVEAVAAKRVVRVEHQ